MEVPKGALRLMFGMSYFPTYTYAPKFYLSYYCTGGGLIWK